MPIDQQSQAVLDRMAATGRPLLHTMVPQIARAFNAIPPDPGPEVAKVEYRLIPGPARDILTRVYTPAGKGPFPVLVWIHGGGWVLGNLEAADGSSRRLAVGAECVVVSVDYRLAPEAKFPAAPEDCYAVTSWVAQNAATINADGNRVAVGGDSAGGNLTAVVSLMARDRGGPPIVFQLMVYPVTDRSYGTRSYQECGDNYGLTKDSMVWFWDHYLTDESEATNPYVSPLRVKDLSGLPPALVITAECDPLRDEGEAYAERLRQAGVPATSTRYDGAIHLFFQLPSLIDSGKKAVLQASTALKAAFAR